MDPLVHADRVGTAGSINRENGMEIRLAQSGGNRAQARPFGLPRLSSSSSPAPLSLSLCPVLYRGRDGDSQSRRTRVAVVLPTWKSRAVVMKDTAAAAVHGLDEVSRDTTVSTQFAQLPNSFFIRKSVTVTTTTTKKSVCFKKQKKMAVHHHS